MTCPKCGFVCETHSLECPRCGLVFAKWRKGSSAPRERDTRQPQQERPEPPFVPVAASRGDRARGRAPAFGSSVSAEEARDPGARRSARGPIRHATADHAYESSEVEYAELPPEPRHMERNDWLVLAAGPILALLIMCFPLLNHIFMTFTTLVHELGHTLEGWIFGYPALPAFDLRYGGGVTATMPRSTLLLVVFYSVMAFLVYTYRKNRLTLAVLVVFLAIHIVLSATTLHEVVFLFMGHGMELVIAGIFFYRALSGAAVVHAAERPLYAIISWFIVLSDFRFAYRLATSAHMRRMYEQAKGGGHWMDFSRIAEDHLHTDLKVVAAFFFVTTLLPLVLGYLAFRYQEYLRFLVVRMWVRDPSQDCVCETTEFDNPRA